jgi:hypothetical protein
MLDLGRYAVVWRISAASLYDRCRCTSRVAEFPFCRSNFGRTHRRLLRAFYMVGAVIVSVAVCAVPIFLVRACVPFPDDPVCGYACFS